MSRTLRNVKDKFSSKNLPKKYNKVNKSSDNIKLKKEIEEELDVITYNKNNEILKLKKQSVVKTKFLKNGIFKKNKK